MNQLALLPLENIATAAPAANGRLMRLPHRPRLTSRTAVGAPGYLSVQAAAERLGLQPRSVRWLIEHGHLASQRLGRIHFVPSAQVEEYRRIRRARARRRQRSLS